MTDASTISFVPPPATRGLGNPLVRSCVFHAVVVLALWGAFSVQKHRIEVQETRVREDLARQEEEIAKEQEQIAQEMAEDAARDQVRMMLTELIHDTVPEADLETLLENMETTLDDLFAQQEDGAWQDMDAEAMDAMRADALAQLQQDQQDLLARTLVAQIRSYVREDLVPELQSEIENRLKNQVGKQIDRDASKALEQARKAGKLETEDVRAAAAAAAEAIQSQVDTATTQAIANELVPKASERVMEAFKKEIAKLPVDADKIAALIEQDIRSALQEDLGATDPSINPATAALNQRYQLADADALDAAQKELAKSRDALNALADRQAEIRENPPTEAIEKQPAQKEQVTNLDQAYQDSRAAVTAANRVAASDKSLSEARKQTSDTKAVSESSKAEQELRKGSIDDATKAMTTSEAEIRQTANALDAAAQSVGEQAEAARAQEAPPTTASAAAAAAAEAAAAAAAENAEGESTKAVAGAAQQVRIAGVLGDELGHLQRLAELGNKLSEAAGQLADGRSVGGPSLLPGAGLMSAQGRPGTSAGLARSQFNRKAYEQFVKDLQNRMNPENAFGEVAETQGMGTRHQEATKEGAERIWISEAQTDRLTKLREPEANPPERKLADPDFPTPAYGGAPMMDVPITIDGDLSDWGELTQPLDIVWDANSATDKVDTGIQVHIRWSARGIFVCYAIADTKGIEIPPANGPWAGECLEYWVDLDNSRRDYAGRSDTAYQFLLAPFGVQDSPTSRFFEYTHGQRNVRSGLHPLPGKGTIAAKQVGNGYTAEAFIDRTALIHPVLLPGQILAMNVSVNIGKDYNNHFQWSASKAISTFAKPDTWGDVVLLGADAKLRFTDVDTEAAAVEWTAPGHPLGLEIADADMNLRQDLRDRVAATVGVDGRSDRLLIILEETGNDTGIFRASVDVRAFLDEADNHTLEARSGSIVVLTYQDPRGAFGEQNRELKAYLPVAFAAQRIANSVSTKTP